MASKKTILVVDDDEEVRKLLEDYLKSTDRYVYTAANLESAMEIAEHHTLDAIFLDDNFMAGTRGVFHIPGLKQTNKKCRVIMLTANTNPDLKQKAAMLGADGLLIKPIEFDTIEKALTPGLFGKDVWQ